MKELWTPVPNYPLYEISNKGRCRYAKGKWQGMIKPPVQPYTYMIWTTENHECRVKYIIISGVTQEREGDGAKVA